LRVPSGLQPPCSLLLPLLFVLLLPLLLLHVLSSIAFTDYIEFEHSENSGNASDEETLLFPGGVHSQQLEERNFFGLLTDIWRVRAAAATAMQKHKQLQQNIVVPQRPHAMHGGVQVALQDTGTGFNCTNSKLIAAALCG
jgi:hypothetical protein